MICSNCKVEVNKLKGRGMCNTCYARWFRSTDKRGFVMKSTHDLSAYFREGCENGDVEDMLQEGMSFAKIAEHYGIGATTVQRLVQKYNLKRSRRFISFSERTEVVVEPDPIKYLALYSQWRTAC